MIEIKVEGTTIDLSDNVSISVEDTSPIFNEIGSQTMPVTAPMTRLNRQVFSGVHRVDAGVNPNAPERCVEVVQGAYSRRGVMNLTEAGYEGFTFNIGFDNSTAYAKWKTRKLGELSKLPVYRTDPNAQGEPTEQLMSYLYGIYTQSEPSRDDFAVFPVAVNKEEAGSDAEKKTYWEVLNLVGPAGLEQPLAVNRVIDSKVTQVSIPDCYMVSPFLRVWRVLELVFADLDMEVMENPFKSDPELCRLVVLNNAADSCCRGEIKYADLMPECMVQEFMNALWTRFGLTYHLDYNMGRVRLRLIKDIINGRDVMDLGTLIAEMPRVSYLSPQYVRLSAKSSIEGAAPACERFEEFAKGLNIQRIRMGTNVSEWQNVGTSTSPEWDGDVSFDPNEEDPWQDWTWDSEVAQPEPDMPEQDFATDAMMLRAAAAPAVTPNTDELVLAREFVTGMWYRLDAKNNSVRLSSSSFFNWDPETENVDALDIASEDEFVPVERVSTFGTDSGHEYNDICPLYLFGARHYHSYVAGGEGSNSKESTPLAFMFAYTKDGKTFGRITPEGPDGKPMTLDDGSTPKTSLLFQFKDGLFARYWKDFDEILRHGNRTIEVDIRVRKCDLRKIFTYAVYRFHGVRCLVDTLSYSLPAGDWVQVTLKLRTIQTQGDYDLQAEQGIPEFAAGSRHLEWRLLGETFGEGLDTLGVKQNAAIAYMEDAGYSPHGPEGNYYCVDARGMMFNHISRGALTWENDPNKPPLTSIDQKVTKFYKATIVYDVYEVHDMGSQEDPDNWELSESPIGTHQVEVQYKTVIAPLWVMD